MFYNVIDQDGRDVFGHDYWSIESAIGDLLRDHSLLRGGIYQIVPSNGKETGVTITIALT